jgi:hypothetical protein
LVVDRGYIVKRDLRAAGLLGTTCTIDERRCVLALLDLAFLASRNLYHSQQKLAWNNKFALSILNYYSSRHSSESKHEN